MTTNKSPEPAKPIYAPSPSGALIAICGEQGAGKTVFLACVFRTVDLVVRQDVPHVTFDRKFGGASYIQSIEEVIATTGKISGTDETVFESCRLLIQLPDRLPGSLGTTLPIDLRDFAGRHFRSYADHRAAMQEGPEDTARDVYAEVEKSLESAVVLPRFRGHLG